MVLTEKEAVNPLQYWHQGDIDAQSFAAFGNYSKKFSMLVHLPLMKL